MIDTWNSNKPSFQMLKHDTIAYCQTATVAIFLRVDEQQQYVLIYRMKARFKRYRKNDLAGNK